MVRLRMAISISHCPFETLGYSKDAFSRLINGIANTNLGLNLCYANVSQLIEATKHGVHLNGRLPIGFPTIY